MVQLLTALPTPRKLQFAVAQLPSQSTRRNRSFELIKQNLGAGVWEQQKKEPGPCTWPEVKHRVEVTGVLRFMGPFQMKKEQMSF